ncbi:acetyl/propionyl/methylcrotonyl-CoA carboxylase subunit alpha [Chelativorans sp. SCAU2101]|jgi:Acetyl/propionyl-CoA carboxylase, alpha subunit|uniref:Acetyl/propionyl/methylcrotonyl-CoA carboxylase subunit alpha n=1 Tax=Chelativorans petroleitrophicus TaxID=2975484 RepID=A0A9X2XBH7_9HYPH|nr:acetyl/propionyl/methylcrotonyl-CoA carboxylase subunit alpha [Chelativorans petroleitrophicus]MCT8991601.1 acetyl/propionyl/methylcrotonyl-CoA carboxylase subunit alpha [Chelativorans petroleitrophicus]
MFTKILIANRGEIAVRVMRTARRMGIATVAVYSDADAHAMHVALADEAAHIGPAPAAESYLDGERIIAAAKATGAEAIHPGYGFLSENPDFAEAVEKAGLVFIGPSPRSIRALGLKDSAKQIMEKAGVPVVPGYHGDAQALVVLATKAREIGYPVLIKARAGGGGRGMRRVDHPDEFADALAAARREARTAFGDDRVIVEKLIEKPRHIEVQVFGDRHGNVVHLFERDCSAQRRHQKVIEEAPAPGMTAAMRMAMTQAAVKAAQAIGYHGAGTVEFIVDAAKGLKPDRFWFMEMNTRLQVEHPVTEMVTGIDLVEWQIRVAAGEALPLSQNEIGLSGHAVEARIYAEDPACDFLPATGTLHHLRFPQPIPGVTLRVETGVRQGDIISAHYDPMIAKLVVHARDRKAALSALASVLEETEIAGVAVNTAFLARLVQNSDFVAGKLNTRLIPRHQQALTSFPEPETRTMATAALAASGAKFAPDAPDPFDAISAYAHFHPITHRRAIRHGDRTRYYAITGLGDGRFAVRSEEENAETLVLPAEYGERIVPWPGHLTIFDGPDNHTFQLHDPLEQAGLAASGSESLRAPMPGLVKLVRVAPGDKVKKGQPLLVLEAMKMEHTVCAPHDGVIAETVAEGARVNDGTVLVRFAESNTPNAGRPARRNIEPSRL